MDIKEQILVALGLNKEETIKLEWQAKSEDGTIFVSTAEELESGVDISVLTEDGTTILLPVGTYKTDTGVSFRVEEEGIVAEVIESETEEVDTVEEEDLSEEVKEEELAEEDDDRKEEADVADWKGMEIRIKNLEDAIADLKADKVEASAETKEEEKTEMSVDVISELMTQIEELNSKIVELSKEPATDSISYNPEGDKNTTSTNLSKLSSNERVAYYINNLK